jgi:hypothetical protein
MGHQDFPGLPPTPWPIDAHCENCGKQLAWCHGVGRYVIRHIDGNTQCHPTMTVAVSEESKKVADALYMEMDRQAAELVAQR